MSLGLCMVSWTCVRRGLGGGEIFGSRFLHGGLPGG